MKNLVKVFFYKMPPSVFIVLILTLGAWAYMLFEKYEANIHPVITDFRISEVVRDSESVKLRGSFHKNRDCDPIALIPYSSGYRIDIETVDYEIESLPTGDQNFGWWLISPPVPTLKVYVRHKCSTGRVITLLYDGILKTTVKK